MPSDRQTTATIVTARLAAIERTAYRRSWSSMLQLDAVGGGMFRAAII
jgi:hypothetical protein